MNTNKNQEGQCGCKTGRSSSERKWEAGKKQKQMKTWRNEGQLVGEQREKGRCIVTMIVTTSEYHKFFPQWITVSVEYNPQPIQGLLRNSYLNADRLWLLFFQLQVMSLLLMGRPVPEWGLGPEG